MDWFRKVQKDLSALPDVLADMNSEYMLATTDIKIKGRIEEHSAKLPGLVEFYYNLLQELESIVEYLEIERRKERSKQYRKYLEGYQRKLSSADAGKFADGEPTVIRFDHLINETCLMRNKFLGIIKSLDVKAWQLGHIVKLRTAGLDDASI